MCPLSCHPRRSVAEIGDGAHPPLIPPGQPEGLSRETGGDDYAFMQPELVALLEKKVGAHMRSFSP